VRSAAGKVKDMQSESGADYLSDGHASSRSSDNESNSVCSEVVGRAVNTVGEFSLSWLLCFYCMIPSFRVMTETCSFLEWCTSYNIQLYDTACSCKRDVNAYLLFIADVYVCHILCHCMLQCITNVCVV